MSDSLQRSAVKRGLSPVVMRDGHDEEARQDDGWIPDVGARKRAGAVRSETYVTKDAAAIAWRTAADLPPSSARPARGSSAAACL